MKNVVIKGKTKDLNFSLLFYFKNKWGFSTMKDGSMVWF